MNELWKINFKRDERRKVLGWMEESVTSSQWNHKKFKKQCPIGWTEKLLSHCYSCVLHFKWHIPSSERFVCFLVTYLSLSGEKKRVFIVANPLVIFHARLFLCESFEFCGMRWRQRWKRVRQVVALKLERTIHKNAAKMVRETVE